METDRRKATEILIDLEERIKVVEGRIKNSENLLKIMLGKLNAAGITPAQPQPASTIINKDNFESRPVTHKFSEAAEQVGIRVDEPEEPQQLNEVFTAKPAEALSGPDEMVEAPIRGNARGQRGPKFSGAKASVSQVLSVGESPLFLANIEILDEQGVLINQARTNTKGRWLMALAPGNYQVHVSKRFPPDSGRNPIDTLYQINVPSSSKPMELDPLSLNE